MWTNPQETADLVTFTKEILNGKPHFLCSAGSICILAQLWLNYCHISNKHAFLGALIRYRKALGRERHLLEGGAYSDLNVNDAALIRGLVLIRGNCIVKKTVLQKTFFMFSNSSPDLF